MNKISKPQYFLLVIYLLHYLLISTDYGFDINNVVIMTIPYIVLYILVTPIWNFIVSILSDETYRKTIIYLLALFVAFIFGNSLLNHLMN